MANGETPDPKDESGSTGPSTSAYGEKFAKYYDVLTGHKDYGGEIAALNEFIRRRTCDQQLRLLDVGCGTGAHARGLCELGHAVTALDLSNDMISVALATPSRVRFLAQDVALLDERDFDFAYSLFNVINCLLSFQGLEAFLAAIYDRIRSGATFLFECWNPIAVVASPPEVVERTFFHNGRHFVRRVTPKSDFFNQRLRLTYDVKIFAQSPLPDSGFALLSDHFYSTHDLMLFTPQELRYFLEKIGFLDVNFRSSLPGMNPVVDKDRMLAVSCRKS